MKKILYLVEEQGFDDYNDNYHTLLHICDNLEKAKELYEMEKCELFTADNFYMSDYLEDGIEHTLISSNNVKLPCFSIENEDGMYELYISEFEKGANE